MSLMILAGNTCYPIFLRFIIWTLFKLLPDNVERWHDWKVTLRFLLDHPRRCYTNLFPSRHTWWLLITYWPQRHRLGRLRDPKHRQPNSTVRPQRCPHSRWPLPSLRRPQRRLLRRPHCQPAHRSPNPLRHHDVHLRLPRRNNNAQLQRLRRTQPRHLRRRPPIKSPRTRPRQ